MKVREWTIVVDPVSYGKWATEGRLDIIDPPKEYPCCASVQESDGSTYGEYLYIDDVKTMLQWLCPNLQVVPR